MLAVMDPKVALLFLAAFAVLVINATHVEEICGKREGVYVKGWTSGQPSDKRPESVEEKKKETKAEENEDDPEKGKFFYQGDIRLTKKQKELLDDINKGIFKRDAIQHAWAKWDNKTVYYELDASLEQSAKDAILAAIRDIEEYTCLLFVVRVDTSIKHYLKFKKDQGCWSYVGRLHEYFIDQGYEQTISIGEGCEYKATCIHEIMHALGFFHEHTRNDRDTYVKILTQNIQAGTENNFNKDDGQISLGVPYDYNSVMHYPDWAFSSNGQPTIEAIGDAAGAEMGQREGLAASDIDAIRKFYECDSDPNAVKRYIQKSEKRSTATTRKTKDKVGGRCEKLFLREEKERASKNKKKAENSERQKKKMKEKKAEKTQQRKEKVGMAQENKTEENLEK